jgi:NAD(P)-dependent dehydrogenase (short-subunit alcohol dehydrogenase family)
MSVNFANKSVLIAGGTGGLGRAVGLAFLSASANVVVTYQRADEFAALKKETVNSAASLEGRQVDVTDEDHVRQLVESTVSKYGRIDVLVNCVGAYAGGMPLWQTEPNILDQMLTLNLRSGFILARHVAPVMLKQGSGSIVNIASQAALNHAPGATAYAASKAAAVAMIDCLAADLKGTGVRANSVLPSIIDTEANRKAMPGADFSTWPKPKEIARVILFLCSDEAKLISGASIPVYGNS